MLEKERLVVCPTAEDFTFVEGSAFAAAKVFLSSRAFFTEARAIYCACAEVGI